jgi:cytochrome c oxidase assembly factor 7
MDLTRVDEEYETKMAAFELDCNDGKGEPSACHHAAEFYSVVKEDFVRSAKMYELNCTNNKYGPSCFNLARIHCKISINMYYMNSCLLL